MIEFIGELAAPCGMNCGVCQRYLATVRNLPKEKGMPACTGCRPRNKNCAFIKGSCELLRANKIDFCFECGDFPCKRLERLNRRYATRYNTSLINNLLEIKRVGLVRWIESEEERWKCPRCGGTVSVHDRKCYDCGYIAN